MLSRAVALVALGFGVPASLLIQFNLLGANTRVAIPKCDGPNPVLARRPALATNFSMRAQTGTYTNPVQDRDLPDPGVIAADGAYWMVHTMGGPKYGWPIYKSTDLIHWEFVTHLLEEGKNKPAWMKDALWAPEIHQVKLAGGKTKFLATGTAWSPESKTLIVALASADKITGPYTVGKSPIVSRPVAVLDTHIFQDDDGAIWLLWKEDSHVELDKNRGIGGTIRARKLDGTGMAFAADSKEVALLTGDPKTEDPAAKWERGLVEAPWVIKRDGWYYLFYSGAFIDTSYSVGVARSKSMTGPFERCPGNPILRSNAKYGGPGHGGFVKDKAGTYWHLYHARHQDQPDKGRVQMLDRLWWNGDWPAFGNGGTPSFTPQPAPVTE